MSCYKDRGKLRASMAGALSETASLGSNAVVVGDVLLDLQSPRQGMRFGLKPGCALHIIYQFYVYLAVACKALIQRAVVFLLHFRPR